jgi:hypothetical protein
MKKITLSVISLFAVTNIYSQCNSFVKSIGSGAYDEGMGIITTSDGGYIMVGTTSYNDIYVLKSDSCGVEQWNKTYDNKGAYDSGKSILELPDGSYFVLGSSFVTSPAFDNNVLAIKINSVGDTIWQKVVGGSLYEQAGGMVQTSDTKIIIAGYTQSIGAGMKDFYAVKMDTSGAVLLEKSYGGANDDQANGIIQTNDGGFALVGTTSSFGAGLGDIWLVKTNSALDSSWSAPYGGSDQELGNALIQVADSGYVMVGGSGSYTTTFSQDMFIVKADKNGTKKWHKIYDKGYSDIANSIDYSNNGGFLVVGNSNVTASNISMRL